VASPESVRQDPTLQRAAGATASSARISGGGGTPAPARPRYYYAHPPVVSFDLSYSNRGRYWR